MSYYAYDADGWLGDVASSKGWEDALRVLLRNTGAPLRMFADRGYTEDPKALAQALDGLAVNEEDIGLTLTNLAELARTADGVLIVSDGVVENLAMAQAFAEGGHWITVQGNPIFVKDAGQRFPRTTKELQTAALKALPKVEFIEILRAQIGRFGAYYYAKGKFKKDGKPFVTSGIHTERVGLMTWAQWMDALRVVVDDAQHGKKKYEEDDRWITLEGVRLLKVEAESDFPNRIVWQDDELVVLPGTVQRYDEEGEWKTINGRRVFIRDSETPTQAIARGKLEQAREVEGSLGGVESSKVLAEIFKYPPPEMTEDAQRTIQNYVTSSGGINNTLRLGGLDQSGDQLRGAVSMLDNLFASSALTTVGMTVSRAIPTHIAQSLGLTLGAVVKDLGYVSTSLSKSKVDSFMGRSTMIFDIKVPVGSKVLSIPSTGVKNQFTMSEAEVLLPRGSAFRISSIKGNVVSAELFAAAKTFAVGAKNAPLYVYRPVVNADVIIAWAKAQGFTTTLPASDMHVTICYSKEPVDWQAAGWPRPDELQFSFNPDQPRDEQGQWADSGGDSSIIEGAAAIAAMNPTKRDNTEIGDFPGGSAAYNLYEARTLLPKPSDKLKKVGDNTFSLGQEYDYIANVDGHHFGISKFEDPDEPDDDSKFVFAYQRLDRATRTSSMRETTTSDVKELFSEMRKHQAVKQHSLEERKVTALGDEGDAIVLQFSAPALQERWQEFRDAGASWDYESYHPHVTITYDKPPDLDLSAVVPYDGPIELGPEVFEDIEEGWHEGVEEHAQDDSGYEGRWVTMHGRHVFIREGETPEQALTRSIGDGESPSGQKLFNPKAGTGAEHLDHVYQTEEEQRVHSINVEHEGPGPYDFKLKSGTDFPAVHPDEPHNGRDAMWPTNFVGKTGGGYIDTSPKTQPVVSGQAMKYWSTGGTARAMNEGSDPHHSLIREVADQHFNIKSSGVSPSALYPASSSSYSSMAKSMVEAIGKSEPAQPSLWRGVYGGMAEQLSTAKIGDEVKWSLGSTSRDPTVAVSYAGASVKDGSSTGKPIIMRIEPGARGIANRKFYTHDQEVITGGKFKVTGVSQSKKLGVMVVDLKQVEVLKW